MKFDRHLHHFIFLVDETNGYAMLRELFCIPDDQSRNVIGQEILDTIQEAWIKYFGFPETVKMDLEEPIGQKSCGSTFKRKALILSLPL